MLQRYIHASLLTSIGYVRPSLPSTFSLWVCVPNTQTAQPLSWNLFIYVKISFLNRCVCVCVVSGTSAASLKWTLKKLQFVTLPIAMNGKLWTWIRSTNWTSWKFLFLSASVWNIPIRRFFNNKKKITVQVLSRLFQSINSSWMALHAVLQTWVVYQHLNATCKQAPTICVLFCEKLILNWLVAAWT